MRCLTIAIIGVLFALAGTVRIEAVSVPAVTGEVLELGTERPLAHVPVLIGTTLITEDRVPATLPRDVLETTTDAEGRFAFPELPLRGGAFVEILPADGHYALHAQIDAARTPSAAYHVSRATEEELAWLAQLNADRARSGLTGHVVIDERAEETARYRAADMALSGLFEHRDAFTHYQSIGGVYPPGPSSASENIGLISTPSTWREVQRLFMESPSHHHAIVDPKVVWAGIAVAVRGKAPASSSGPVDYYAQVFVNRP
jgi:uncharacterized protein YkwD